MDKRKNLPGTSIKFRGTLGAPYGGDGSHLIGRAPWAGSGETSPAFSYTCRSHVAGTPLRVSSLGGFAPSHRLRLFRAHGAGRLLGSSYCSATPQRRGLLPQRPAALWGKSRPLTPGPARGVCGCLQAGLSAVAGRGLTFPAAPSSSPGAQAGSPAGKTQTQIHFAFQRLCCRDSVCRAAVRCVDLHLHPQTRHNPWKFRGLV